MNRIMSLKIFISVILLNIFSCSDIFEIDISSDEVELLAPSDSLVTTEQLQRFWWTTVTGSMLYELQVVSPSFSEISSVKLDTVLEKNYFQLSLQPGFYQWRVRAINGSSCTGFSINTFEIDTL